MKARLLGLVLLLSTALSGLAYAQNCPSGIPAGGNPMCIPPSNPASPLYRSRPEDMPVPAPRPSGRWFDSWGAATADYAKGIIGTSLNEPTQSRALDVARESCTTPGGVNCKIVTVFSNQCAAVVWPTGGGDMGVAHDMDESVAIDKAMSLCEANGKGCQLVAAGCARPTFLPF